MKSKNMTLMAIAIVCGLVAAFLTAKLSGGSTPDTIDVIVAKKELTVGTLLEEKELETMLGTQKVQKSNLPPDIINTVDELKGKKLNRTLKPGNFFSTGDVGADNGIKLPEGMYKYAIKTDGVKAVAGFVQPGDRVDVILTESQGNRAKSGMILRDMLVLAVDTSSRRREGGEAIQQVNSVSLAVSSEQSLTLSSAERRGDVKLVLRDQKNPDKSHVAATSTIPGFDVVEGLTQQAAAPPAKTTTVVVTKADVPENTQVTKDNFDEFFSVREVPEEGILSDKTVKDPMQLWGKYVIRKLDANMAVFSSWLSEDKTVVEALPNREDLEVLPTPHEVAAEKPLYPRKFEQIINNQRHFFIEVKPGDFRRVDAGAEIKDLPDSNARPEPAEQKNDEKAGDRRV